MKIKVVNKHWHKPTPDDVYVGRGSPYGNRYSWLPGTPPKFLVKDREEAIEKYREWFEKQCENNQIFRASLMSMARYNTEISRDGINLVCYCAPASCHGDVIKKYLDNELGDKHSNEVWTNQYQCEFFED